MAIFRVEPLSRKCDRTRFSCGVAVLDRYLTRQAGQDQAKNAAAVFLLVESDGDRIAGYYTLSAFAVPLDDLPENTRKNLPRYRAVPVAFLGRLAIDEAYQGRGLGGVLIADALEQVRTVQRYLATWAIVVDAIDENAARFYERFGFVRFPRTTNRLFLPLRSFRSAVPEGPDNPAAARFREYHVDP